MKLTDPRASVRADAIQQVKEGERFDHKVCQARNPADAPKAVNNCQTRTGNRTGRTRSKDRL